MDLLQAAYQAGFAAGYSLAMNGSQLPISQTPTMDEAIAEPTKPKRKASAYSKRYGRAYRQLRKKHPRMAHASIVKKAHKQAKRDSK